MGGSEDSTREPSRATGSSGGVRIGLVPLLAGASTLGALVVTGALLTAAPPESGDAVREAAAERAANEALEAGLAATAPLSGAVRARLGAAVVDEPPEGSGTSARFAVLFGVIVVGLALLPGLVLAQRLAGDLRRVERGLRALAARETTGEEPPSAVDVSRRRLPEADDELGLTAWTFDAVRDRLAADIDRFQRMRAKLARADQDKLDFLAVMSHELRTPLNTILGFSEVLLDGYDGPMNPGQREDLRIVRDSGDHLLGLVNDILDLSALQAGQLALDLGEVDVVDVCRAVLDEAEGQLRERPVRLATKFAAERLVVRADARLVRRIVQNLVGNASKFTKTGEIRVSGTLADGDVLLEVRDTGPGIPSEALATIFEEYRQAGDARTKREGTGLGLAIVRRLVEMHGGGISAESEVGKGSTFRVRLPVEGPAEEAGGE